MELKQDTLVAERFRLTRMIGRGGMGSVWAAQDCRLDNQCAVKFIEGEIANIADAHARFAREAKAAAQLRSPHVVEIKDYGLWEGRPYIAMELLEGEDLGKFLAQNGGKLHASQVNPIIQQVCRALTKAHAAGIVHRDLKPDNIFLVNDDDRQLVKILDFGVAKQTSQAIEGSNTKTGAMLGTPYYMSPEQAQGIKTVDSRSDLWSLAVIVYHCITGKLPFESEALGDLLVKIIVNPIPTPSHVAQVPPGFDRWWAKAAAREPEARFQTAKDFAVDLALALGGTVDIGNIGTRTPPQFTGTAMMTNAALPPSAFQSTPQPTASASASAGMPAAGMSTPQPMMNTPQGGLFGHSGQRQGPPMNTPPPGLSPGLSPGLGGSGSPATFSGVEPPFAIPKKGPPPALLAVVGVLAVLALVGIGLMFSRKTSVSAHEPPPSASVSTVIPSASASATMVASAVPPAESETAEPPPSESAPPPSATTTATAATTAATTATATTAAGTHPTHVGGGPKPPVTPPTKPTAAASTKKWNAGF